MEMPPAWSSVELGRKSPFSDVIQWKSAMALTLSECAYLQGWGLNMHFFKLSLTREIPNTQLRKLDVYRVILAPLSSVKCTGSLNFVCWNLSKVKEEMDVPLCP